jgi:hypothetical protein
MPFTWKEIFRRLRSSVLLLNSVVNFRDKESSPWDLYLIRYNPFPVCLTSILILCFSSISPKYFFPFSFPSIFYMYIAFLNSCYMSGPSNLLDFFHLQNITWRLQIKKCLIIVVVVVVIIIIIIIVNIIIIIIISESCFRLVVSGRTIATSPTRPSSRRGWHTPRRARGSGRVSR